MKGEQGRAIEWGWIQFGPTRASGYTVNVDKDDVIRCLKQDAEDTLPTGTRYEIRQRHSNNFGRTHGLAWYRRPDFDAAEAWGHGEFPRLAEDLYLLIGQFTTPENNALTVTTGASEL